MDLVSPLPPSCGFTHLQVVPLSSTTLPEVAWALVSAWVAGFGTPSDLTSDRGTQFTSELWTMVAGNLGVKLHRTTAYNPQANGLCVRFHCSMKAALRSTLTDGNWMDRLPWVLLGPQSTPNKDLQSSLAELVFGQTLRVPDQPQFATLRSGMLLVFLLQFPCITVVHQGPAVGWLCVHLS